MKTFLSRSPEETIEFGRKLASSIKRGTVIALTGDLGSGKTTFVKGLALGFGVQDKKEVKSPTFVIMHMYKGSLLLYHFDLYRLNQNQDLQDIGIEDYLCDSNAVSVIEWAERVQSIYDEAHIKINITRVNETSRQLTVTSGAR